MTRGVLLMVWKGDYDASELVDRVRQSVREYHPDMPVHVEHLPDGSSLLDKSQMLDLSPFDETLFLDADTVVLGDLSFGFEQAGKHGIACCICECPWARRYLGLQHCEDIVEYNTGVLFFTKDAKPVFDEWQLQCERLNSAHYFMSPRGRECMPENDQAGFAGAIRELDFNPFVLPLNWNFRQQWHRGVFGPIRIWHDTRSVPSNVRAWNERYIKQDEPLGFALVQP